MVFLLCSLCILSFHAISLQGCIVCADVYVGMTMRACLCILFMSGIEQRTVILILNELIV